jgi:hypothetical protein
MPCIDKSQSKALGFDDDADELPIFNYYIRVC